MFSVPLPAKMDGDSLRDELASVGLDRETVFYVSEGVLFFDLADSLRDKVVALLGRHKGEPKPVPPTPDQSRLTALETWSTDVNAVMDQLILDTLFGNLSDEDILGDLGGL